MYRKKKLFPSSILSLPLSNLMRFSHKKRMSSWNQHQPSTRNSKTNWELLKQADSWVSRKNHLNNSSSFRETNSILSPRMVTIWNNFNNRILRRTLWMHFCGWTIHNLELDLLQHQRTSKGHWEHWRNLMQLRKRERKSQVGGILGWAQVALIFLEALYKKRMTSFWRNKWAKATANWLNR